MRLAPLLLLALGLAAAAAAAQAEGGVYTARFHLGGDLYLVEFNVTSSRYITGSGVFELTVEARVVYATSSEPIVVDGDVYLGNVSLGSLVLGPLAVDRPARGRLVSPVPPQALQGLAGPAAPAFIRIVFTAYRGTASSSEAVLVPVVVVEEEPGLQVLARYSNGSTISTAVLGRDMSRRIYVDVVNTGSTEADMVTLSVSVGGATVYRALAAKSLPPGHRVEAVVEAPTPQEPGLYQVNVTASGVCGGRACTATSSLRLLVAPEVRVSAVLANESVVAEGEKVCLRVLVYPPPRLGKPILLLEERPSGAPGWATVATAPLQGDATEGLLCTTAHGVPPGAETLLELRARLLARIDGAEYSAASSPVPVRVVPLSELLRSASLTVVAAPARAYLVDRVEVHLTLTPSVRACLPAAVEVFRDGAWVPVAETRVCSGSGLAVVDAASLGAGRLLLRGVVTAGSRRIASEPVILEVYPLPRLEAHLEPPAVAPGSRLSLRVKLAPALHALRVSAYLSWLGVWVNTTSTSGEAVVPLEAPSRPGSYPVRVIATAGGFRGEQNLTLRVEKPRIHVKPEPAAARPGEKVAVHVAVEPPVDARVVLSLLSGSKPLLNTTLYVVRGRGEASIDAPAKPGNYTLTATIPGMNASASTRLTVEKPSYRVSLVLNATRVAPGAPLRAEVRITPSPPGPAVVALMAAPAGNSTLWQTLASVTVDSSGKAEATIHAPRRPGTYTVKAVASSLGAESRPLRLEVARAAAGATPRPGRTSIEVAMMAAAVAAVAWSLRSLKRR